MARVPLYEYTAKRLLIGDAYTGLAIRKGEAFPEVPEGNYVVKVDQGVKKRGKMGLIKLNVSADKVGEAVAELSVSGYTHFLAEPMVAHEQNEERYLSLSREREGLRVIASTHGGISIEEMKRETERVLWKNGEVAPKISAVPEKFLTELREKMQKYHISFLELNPFLIQDEKIIMLDAAVKVDDAGAYAVNGAWTFADVPQPKPRTIAEERVHKLDESTPASLKLSVLNENGSLFFLLSSGGASIVLADDAYVRDMGKEIANYGEYSGAPTRTETYLYAREVLGLLLKSTAKKKALVIAGGVANFTDIKETFSGILDALEEARHDLQKLGVKVFVRRGGPNEEAGLKLMREFLEKYDLLGSVHGSETPLTMPVGEAINFLK